MHLIIKYFEKTTLIFSYNTEVIDCFMITRSLHVQIFLPLSCFEFVKTITSCVSSNTPLFASAFCIEHDNRGEEVRRTVSFKSTRGNPSGSNVGGGGVSSYSGRGRNNMKWTKNMRNHLQYDTDIDMGGSGQDKK